MDYYFLSVQLKYFIYFLMLKIDPCIDDFIFEKKKQHVFWKSNKRCVMNIENFKTFLYVFVENVKCPVRYLSNYFRIDKPPFPDYLLLTNIAVFVKGNGRFFELSKYNCIYFDAPCKLQMCWVLIKDRTFLRTNKTMWFISNSTLTSINS